MGAHLRSCIQLYIISAIIIFLTSQIIVSVCAVYIHHAVHLNAMYVHHPLMLAVLRGWNYNELTQFELLVALSETS